MVFGMPRFPGLARCYAEYVAAPAADLAVASRRVSAVEAASVPLRGLTALQTLDAAGVVAGQRALVHGAAGGLVPRGLASAGSRRGGNGGGPQCLSRRNC